MAKNKVSLVDELEQLHRKLDVVRLYNEPGHKLTKDWLAKVGGVLKNLDETDYNKFMEMRQHIYRSVSNRELRKENAELIDNFVRQKVAEYKRHDFESAETGTAYVKQEIIESFVNKQDTFNYKKLIRLLGELNYNFAAGYPYSSSMLIRGILDHIPPIFGHKSFEEVVNNYSWSKTDKKYMKSLLDFKKNGDDTLHRQISIDADLMEMGDIPPSNRINRLLQECLKVAGTKKQPETKSKTNNTRDKKIKVKLAEDKISWANYSLPKYVWSCFRVTLEIDNYANNNPDYVSVYIEAKTINGADWKGDYYNFENDKNQDNPLRVEGKEIKRATVFISSYKANGSKRMLMPDFDKNTLQIKVKTKSGTEIRIPIPEKSITKG